MKDFSLSGAETDETRQLLDRASGFSIPIPGHPRVVPVPAEPPRYDTIIALTDLPIEHGFRLDTLPAGADPQQLATSLVAAYASERADVSPHVRPVPEKVRTEGATAASIASYLLRGASTPTIEQLIVTVRARKGGLWALYHTSRHAIRDVNAVQWAHVRTAILDKGHWDPELPRTVSSPVWPMESAFAELSTTLTLTPAAWADAQAKAIDIGPLTDAQTQALIEKLLEISNTDDPPTFELHAYLAQLHTRQLAMIGPSRAADALLRNLDQVKTTHDLRAWCWQGIWAIGNRDDRGADQRTTS